MTTSQAKLISMIRSAGGEIEAWQIPTFRYRSVEPLIRAGFLRRVNCGECLGCQFGKEHHEDWHCEKTRIKVVAPQ